MRIYYLIGLTLSVTLLNGCANGNAVREADGAVREGVGQVPTSFLNDVSGDDSAVKSHDTTENVGGQDDARPAVVKLEPISWQAKEVFPNSMPKDLLSDEALVSVSAEGMSFIDFIHYVFGDLLALNYVFDASMADDQAEGEGEVTLNIANTISARELFNLVGDMLIARGVNTKYSNGTFLLYRPNASTTAPQVEIGFGREPSEVPETAQRIMQVVPIRFGIKVSLERPLREMTTAKIVPDFSQSVIFVEGSREEILRALELIEMLDTPSMRGRHIGLIELSFLEPGDFSSQVTTLLMNEGIEAAVGGPNNKNLVMVPLDQLNSLAVFATNKFLLDRVSYWATVLDLPSEGPEKGYFMYKPRFARAKDLGESIEDLLGLASLGEGAQSLGVGGSTGNAPSTARRGVVDDISLVVDEMSNILVFYSSGLRYRGLLPLLRKLDVMPKQVMLDILIAEVTLKDEFKHGVEWALARKEVTLTTQGAFGATGVGGMGLLIEGSDGPLQANFLATNSLVNVLSNPTLMVRDGVSASISVGSTISVVGETKQDPINGDRQTTSAAYRNTGIDVNVLPTITGSGIVLLEISESISNTVPGTVGAGGNPDIFQRTLKTEVMASSGQTVMLAGLISENYSKGGSGTPGISRIPLLGNLFKAETQSSDRTELVMLITPKVVEDLTGWDPLIDAFRKGLRFLYPTTK